MAADKPSQKMSKTLFKKQINNNEAYNKYGTSMRKGEKAANHIYKLEEWMVKKLKLKSLYT